MLLNALLSFQFVITVSASEVELPPFAQLMKTCHQYLGEARFANRDLNLRESIASERSPTHLYQLGRKFLESPKISAQELAEVIADTEKKILELSQNHNAEDVFGLSRNLYILYGVDLKLFKRWALRAFAYLKQDDPVHNLAALLAGAMSEGDKELPFVAKLMFEGDWHDSLDDEMGSFILFYRKIMKSPRALAAISTEKFYQITRSQARYRVRQAAMMTPEKARKFYEATIAGDNRAPFFMDIISDEEVLLWAELWHLELAEELAEIAELFEPEGTSKFHSPVLILRIARHYAKIGRSTGLPIHFNRPLDYWTMIPE